MEKIPFKVEAAYSRADIYRIISVPKEKQKGIWHTGYVQYNNDWYIFAHVNTTGRTGHDYNNLFDGNDFIWYGKNNSKLFHDSIQGILNPKGNVYIFVREDNNDLNFTYLGIGTPKEVFDESPVKIIWEFTNKRENHPEMLAEEVIRSDEYLYEGLAKTIKVNSFERNPLARKKCIDHYGTICSVCNFNFIQKYGELGNGFIHVHHLVPLNEVRERYVIDPIKDLRPVCPNCHAMLHRRTPSLSIEELKSLLLNYL